VKACPRHDPLPCGALQRTLGTVKRPGQPRYLALSLVLGAMVGACGGEPEAGTPATTQTPTTAAVPSSTSTAVTTPAPDVRGDPGGTKVVVDTDMSTDDLMAIAMLLGSPRVEVAAITIVGAFVRCPRGESVMLGFLASLGVSGIPVACGPTGPLEGTRAFPEDWRNAADQAWGIPLAPSTERPFAGGGVALMREAIGQGATTVVMLGPHTNLARLLRETPEVANEIELMLTMAGAVDVVGNVYQDYSRPPLAAEWNVYVDPVAADEVFRSGLPIVMVGLDATNAVPVTGEFVKRLRAEGSGVSVETMAAMIERNKLADAFDSYFWDGLAVAYLLDPTVVSLQDVTIRVVTDDGPDSGRTVRDPQGAPIRVAVDGDRVLFEDLAMDSLSRR
jgi:inosine-uridine nucleoside N-ribohydrolase